jgi:hypothetical protein
MKVLFGFGCGFLVFVLLLTFLPRPISDRLTTLRADGLRLVEVYNRIAQDPRQIDIAFIGTSHTMNGIDDFGIEESLTKVGVRANVANLGAMWMGRDMHLFLTKQLLTNKKPQLIILEINEHEPPYGHPLMPYVASASDMFCCRFWADFNFPKMFLLFLKEQLYGSFSAIWPSVLQSSPAPRTWEYGWDPMDHTWNAEMSHNPSFGDRLEKLAGSGLRAAAYSMTSDYGNQAVRQIVGLAHLNHVEILFLYLPEYIYAAAPNSDDIRFYSEMAPVLLPPRDIVASQQNWGDFAHLNRSGALKLAPHLASDIADYLANKQDPAIR